MSGAPESRGEVVRRRLVTIPRSIVLLAVMIALAPLVLPAAALVDLIRWALTRKPAMTLRLLAVGFVFLSTELFGLVRLLVSWLAAGFGANRAKLLRDSWAIQAWWAGALLASAQRIFRLDFNVAGREDATPGPMIAMFRHTSIVDNLLPAVLLGVDHGIHLRWIVKRELLTLPSLDVAGKRLPNYFVNRTAADPPAELRRIRQLAEGMGADDGVLIFPEGTRFTAERQQRAVAKLRESGDGLAERAAGLRHVMPPRPGGTLALLDSGADVVIGAHTGLEGFAKPGDLWSGALLGRTIEVEFIRIPAAAIPEGRAARVEWLYGVWEDLDRWIEHHPAGRKR